MASILSSIRSPDDLKSLDKYALHELAHEIRQIILKTVSQTGGHLAANLGVVELSLALHRVFHSPVDKIIWDVGHQCYTHKILTGRGDCFHTLRQYKGINGFPRRDESIHDAFGTGHSSTSISAAVGMCIARDKKGENHKVVAVIGDGSLTGGIAFEALNHAGALGRDLLVILNDNKMSISPNVGALSIYLNRIITGKMYNRVKREIEAAIRSVPQIGIHMARVASRLDDAIKSLVVPGIMFEELGFKYIGPIPGHNLNALIDTLEAVKRLRRPILLHIITKKGKGYTPAENNPSTYHNATPSLIEAGNNQGKAAEKVTPTYTEAFSRTLVQLAQDNPHIVGITAAMPKGTGLDRFAHLFPDRFFDVGIAEEHAVTMAAGMACEGLRPVVAIYSTFLQRAYDQILHDVCLQKLPVILAIDRAGVVGEDGPTHHGAFDLSFLRTIPNLVLMAPKDENELQHMLYTATLLNVPVAIRYPREGEGVGLENTYRSIPMGKGELLRKGSDVCLLAVGTMVHTALAAADQLHKEGISAQVINARFIKPLDRELLLEATQNIGKVVTLEENALTGGFGSAVLEFIAEERPGPVQVHRLGIPDQFIPAGSKSLLRQQLGLDVQGIVKAVGRLCNLSLTSHSSESWFMG
ncbi:MAG: 1-deoxy-D-xylulose-5-phosphate synthase [bacterium]